MNHNEAYQHLEYLSVDCGSRVAGSESARKAANYIERFFNKKEIQTKRHNFGIPHTKLKTSSLKVQIDGEWKEIPHKPVWFAGETPLEGIEAPLVYGGDGSEAVLRRVNPEGKVLLIARDSYMDYPDDIIYRRLIKYNPLAVIFTTDAGHGGSPDIYYNFKTVETVPPPPSAVIHYFDGVDLS